MWALEICLWIAGFLCLLAGVGMVLPFSGWTSVVKFFGVDSLPDSPVLMYMTRLLCATYVGIGVFFIILALDPVRYGIMVPFAGVAAVLLGLACAIVGLAAKMPALWFLSDSLFSLVLGVLILLFWKMAN